jgi:hypothetical protein
MNSQRKKELNLLKLKNNLSRIKFGLESLPQLVKNRKQHQKKSCIKMLYDTRTHINMRSGYIA